MERSPRMSEEVRSVDPETGAEKGTKLARHSLIPSKALTEIAEHYGRGSQKYSDNNWRKGYAWSKSYDALCRHLTQFWGGEDIDEETGSKHIIAVAWHAIALSVFMDEQKSKDDRFTDHLTVLPASKAQAVEAGGDKVRITVNTVDHFVPLYSDVTYAQAVRLSGLADPDAAIAAGWTVLWSGRAEGGILLPDHSVQVKRTIHFDVARTDNA